MRFLMSLAAKAFNRYSHIIEGELELTCYVDDREINMVNDDETITVTIEDCPFVFTKDEHGWIMK